MPGDAIDNRISDPRAMHQGGSGVTKRMEIESGPIDTIFLAVARKPLREAMARAPVGTPGFQPRKYSHLIVLRCSSTWPRKPIRTSSE
jgi:hypothetical protein